MGIGYSPEGRRVFNSLTVTENILSGSLSIPMVEARKNLDWLLQTFPLLAQRANQPANQALEYRAFVVGQDLVE